MALYAAVLDAIPELRTYCDCLQDIVWALCMLEQVNILYSLPLLQDGTNLSLSSTTELVILPTSAVKGMAAISG